MNPFDVVRSSRRPIDDIAVDRPANRRNEVRTDRSGNDRVSDSEQENERNSRASRAQFAQILALLAGAGGKARTDLLKQMPAEGAALLDKLLGNVNTEGEVELSPDSSASADSLLADNGDAIQGDAAAALRYNLIKNARAGILDSNRSTSTEGGNDSLRGIHGIARAVRNVPESDALARLVERRGSSVEELLALGDGKTAELKRALDALLSRVGEADAHDHGSVDSAVIADATARATAHSHALSEAHRVSAADVTTPVRDEEALAPEFRDRLDRVIERMKSEYGHDVRIVETARSQDRQDHLYAQGRTRGGPVVTWTRDSAHISGHAADVIIDDKWQNAEGYARLQRIAREEGLRTLGMRDPGHLELPRELRTSDGVAANATKAFDRNGAAAEHSFAPARGIARVAQVAAVASVARVSDSAEAARGNAPAAPMSANASATAHTAVASARQQAAGEQSQQNMGQHMSQHMSQDSQRGTRQGSSKEDVRVDGEFASPAIGPRFETGGQPNHGAAAADRAQSANGAAAFDRVMEAQRVRDNAPARPVSQLTLEVDAPDGSKDQITIGMRGNSVGAHITTDAANAERLRMRTGELQEALSRRGLETDSVRISNKDASDVAKSIGAASERDATRIAGAQQSQQGDNQMSQQRERAGNQREWQERQDARREREEQRHEAGQHEQRQRRNPFNPNA